MVYVRTSSWYRYPVYVRVRKTRYQVWYVLPRIVYGGQTHLRQKPPDTAELYSSESTYTARTEGVPHTED